MLQISDSIFVETDFQGANVGAIVTAEGLVMIDAPFSPLDAVKWRAELDRQGQVIYLINTEHHMDHATCDCLFPGTVVATQWSRQALEQPGEAERARRRVEELWPECRPILASYRPRLPTITFSREMWLYLGGVALHLVATPGHTPGGLAVHFPQERVLFTGDNVVCRYGPAFRDALPREWFNSLDLIEALDVEVIVPGHGPACDKSYVAEFRGELEGYMAEVRDAIARGLTREETAERFEFLKRYAAGGNRPGPDGRPTPMQREGIMRVYELLKG
ncbi:MAG: MBL fold metallo-hydrolase [Chloroflexi bacterium]|nr:MBL fold metallo-hydrolase [Chloroflexota bacterium]